MKYVITHGISEYDFQKEPFDIHDSIDDILRDFRNATKLYVLEVDDNISGLKKLLFSSGFSKDKLFKNYYTDSEKNLVRLVRKVPVRELLQSVKATSDYFFKYAVENANELQQEDSIKSLNIILEFLIQENINPDLLINFCVRLPKCNINLAEEYIISNHIENNFGDTQMLIEFANKLENCDVNKIVKAIADSDKSPHCLGLLKDLSKITNENLTLDYVEDIIIEKDKKGNLIYELANKYNNICNVGKLSRALVEIDKNGYISYLFATNIKGVDKKFFQESIAEKDKKGTYCISLASENGFDTDYLLDRVLELDKNNGAMAIEFIKKNPKCNLDKALDYLLEHDDSGRYILEFANLTNGYNSDKLVERIIEIDTDGKLSFLFALTVPNSDISKLKSVVSKANNPVLFSNLFTGNINSNNKNLFINQIKKIDETGKIIEIIAENKTKSLTKDDLLKLQTTV